MTALTVADRVKHATRFNVMFAPMGIQAVDVFAENGTVYFNVRSDKEAKTVAYVAKNAGFKARTGNVDGKSLVAIDGKQTPKYEQ